ncbi:MAG: hypothetical protein UW69_C0043G0003 [Microgenomates group bacterium GW2011_GWA2_44_7]|nr:MAG: hypothetical protein UW69_C0043G0003 [Microgenomates group bacterium GW2011_GWA2_44_7]
MLKEIEEGINFIDLLKEVNLKPVIGVKQNYGKKDFPNYIGMITKRYLDNSSSY